MVNGKCPTAVELLHSTATVYIPYINNIVAAYKSLTILFLLSSNVYVIINIKLVVDYIFLGATFM